MPNSIPAPWWDDVTPSINDPDGFVIKKMAAMDAQSLGKMGSLYTATAGTYSGNFSAVSMVGETVLDSITGFRMTGYTGGITFSDGYMIVGAIQEVVLTSGAIILYRS